MDKKSIIRQGALTAVMTRQQLTAVLSGGEDEFLFKTADRVRREQVGDVIHLRAILEFSNYCRCQCLYCGLRAGNFALPRYRMELQEIADCTQEAWEAGYRTIVLQSGEDLWYTRDKVCAMIEEILRRCPIVITLSIGERPAEEYEAFLKAGASRYLLKHETSDPQIYQRLHPGFSQENRLRCLRDLKALGYETGSGFMIGLPGQSESTIADDILLLQKIGCHMAGIGPFLPHPETPLRDQPPGSALMTRRAVALTRLLLPKANLPATTSLGVLSGDERSSVFSCGANVMMRKVTPWSHRRQYEIYPAGLGEELTTRQARIQLEEYIKSLGKQPL